MHPSWITQSIKRMGRALGALVFPPPPLKFRTAGFPQYGFKREIRTATFDGARGRLICGASPGPCLLWPRRASVKLSGGRSPERSRPEALGSPAGYAVPPGLGLLRPHVSLSAPLLGLSASSRRVCVRPARPDGEPRGSPIYSACLSSRAAFRTPADRTVAPGCSFTARSGLRLICTGSASAVAPSPILRCLA